jgi:ferredoxin
VFCAWFAFIALDARRFGWSHVPLWAQGFGTILIVWSFRGWVTVLRANSFAAVAVRVQGERNQTVISTGPYAVVRHPMYAYAIPFSIGTPLMLGSLWGLLGLIPFFALIVARTLGEEAVLREGPIPTTRGKCASDCCPACGEAVSRRPSDAITMESDRALFGFHRQKVCWPWPRRKRTPGRGPSALAPYALCACAGRGKPALSRRPWPCERARRVGHLNWTRQSQASASRSVLTRRQVGREGSGSFAWCRTCGRCARHCRD